MYVTVANAVTNSSLTKSNGKDSTNTINNKISDRNILLCAIQVFSKMIQHTPIIVGVFA